MGTRTDRQEHRDRYILVEKMPDGRQVVLVVPLRDGAPHFRWRVLVLDRLEAVTEVAQRVGNHLGLGEQAQIVGGGAEVVLDLSRLALPLSCQLIVDRRFQRIAAADISEYAGHENRNDAEQQQNGEELDRQSTARRAGDFGGRRDGHS